MPTNLLSVRLLHSPDPEDGFYYRYSMEFGYRLLRDTKIHLE